MRTRFFGLVLTMLMVIGLLGCGQDADQAKSPQQAAAAAANQRLQDQQAEILSLQSQVRQRDATITAYRDSLTSSRAACDSLSTLVIQRRGDLALCRSSIKTALDQLDETTAFFETAMQQCHDTLTARTEQWRHAAERVTTLEGHNDLLRAQNEQVTAWMHFYQKKSERSIFKHLFGAGVPPQPDVPHPGD